MLLYVIFAQQTAAPWLHVYVRLQVAPRSFCMPQLLQGVTEANYRQLMSGVGCLADLAELSQEELQRLMGGEAAAKKLHAWLHAVVPTLTAS
jgi:ERCC4-type nuclease